MKPQAETTTPTPPQFGHDGIDPVRALLVLGLPLLATAGTLLVLFASPLVWWIAGGVAAAGVAGGVVLRRSRRARGALRRFPGVKGATSALRRTSNGRFSRSPLGRVFNRALGRRPTASSASTSGTSPSRPKTLGGKLRSMLPSWAGGTRKPSSSTGSGASGKPSRGGRMKSLLNRLKPGGGRRPSASGGASPNGAKPKTGSLFGRAARSVRKATGKASRAVGSKLFRIRPGASPTNRGGSSKPKGKGKTKPAGGGGGGSKPSTSTPLDLGVVWTGLGASGRLIGRGAGALLTRWRKRKKTDPEDTFDPDSTYEVGIEGEVVDGKHTDPELGEIAKRARKAAAKRARKLANQRAKQAEEAAKAAPEWPNLDIDDVPLPPVQGPQPAPEPPPDYEPDIDDHDDHDDAADQSLSAERDRDPPPSPPVSPSSHRETRGETRGEEPRVTSANITHGGTMTNATNYVEMIDNSTPTTYAATCREAGEQARRDGTEKEEEAKRLRHEASSFDALPGAANKATAQKLRSEAASCEEDARSRLHWASRLDGMANDAEAKLAS